MDKINISCIFCGETYLEDLSNKETTCPNCKESFETTKGSKYYKGLQKAQKQDNKTIINEKYNQIDLLLDKAQYYLDNEKYDMCENTLNKLLELNDKDRRIYLLFLYAKTKNLTDLKDKTHYPYLEKLIELSNSEEKKQVKKIYSVYYKKSKLTDEELELYNDNLSSKKKNSLEKALKDGIPTHYENARKVKVYSVFAVLNSVAFITLAILYFTLSVEVLSYIASAVSALLLGCVMIVINLKPKIALYDAVLDLYDNFETFKLSPNQKLLTIKRMSAICEIFLNNGSNYSLKTNAYFLVNDLLSFDNKKVYNFISNYKALSKFIPKQ